MSCSPVYEGKKFEDVESLKEHLENLLQRENEMNVADAMLPSATGTGNVSAYPMMDAYFQKANLASLDLMAETFFTETEYGRGLVESIMHFFKKPEVSYDENIEKKAKRYILQKLLSTVPFFDISPSAKKSLMFGEESPTLEIGSVAQRLSIIKNMSKEKDSSGELKYPGIAKLMEDSNHPLNRIKAITDPVNVEKNSGLHLVELDRSGDSSLDDEAADYFESMFFNYNLDISEHEGNILQDIAQDLVRVLFISKGASFQGGSISPIVPVRVWEHLEVGEILNNFLEDTDAARDVFGGFTEFTEEFARINYNDPKIVPIAPKKITFVGEYAVMKFPKRSELPAYTVKGKEKKLYKLISIGETGEDYYLPISKLGVPNKLVEFGSSIIPENNVKESFSKLPHGSKENSLTTDQKVQKLQANFEAAGIGVEIRLDESMEENAKVQSIDGKNILTLNPNKVFSDTVPHEFGHIYVDLLTTSNPLVSMGIDQLRGTELYNEVAEKYPELSGEELDKEVLVTAIGREGAKIFEQENLPKWRKWLNKFFRAVGNLFGIQPNAAKVLAEQMIEGNMSQQEFGGKLSSNPWYQKDFTSMADYFEKTATNLKHQANKFSNNPEYAKKMEDLLQSIQEHEDAENLATFAKHMQSTLKSIDKKFSNYEEFDYNTLEDEALMDKEVELANVLHHSDVMLKSFKDMQYLHSDKATDEEVKKLLKEMKSRLSDITDLEIRLRKLRDDSLRRRLYKHSTNPDVVEGVVDMFSAEISDRGYYHGGDEGLVQLSMDALADTNNTFIATLMKEYSIEEDKFRHKTVQIKQRWRDIMQFAKEKGIDMDFFFEKDSEGNNSGRYISKYNEAAFEDSKQAMFTQAAKLKADGREKEAGKLIYEWHTTNVKPIPEYYKMKRDNEKNMTADEYLAWLEETHGKNSRGKYYPKGDLVQPTDIWKNENYADMVFKDSHKDHLRVFNEIEAINKEITKHLNGKSLIKDGYLPMVKKDDRSLTQIAKDAVNFKKKRKVDPELEEPGVITDENGTVVSFIPLHYTRFVTDKKYEKIPENASEEEVEKIKRKNMAIYRQMQKDNAANIDYNVEETMELLIDSAMNHQFKRRMESTLLSAKEKLADMELLPGNKWSFNEIHKRVTGKEIPHVIKGKDSNLYKHLDRWIQMVFYEDFDYGDSNEMWKKVTRTMQNFSSYTGIGFNVFSALNNKAYGEIQIAIEAAAAEHFNKKDWVRAKSFYNKNMLKFFGRRKEFKSVSLAEAIVKHFDILESQDETTSAGSKPNSKLHKLMFVKNAAYAMQHAGEHSMQNQVLFAMLSSNKVLLDGKETSLLDALELRDGFLAIKEGVTTTDGKKFTQDNLSELRNKIIGLNQHLHGIYNRKDAGTVQRYALGRLAIQFRKWARPGWNKRFGTKFGKSFWNERREMRDEGMYTVAAKFMWELIKDIKHLNTNAKLQWGKLDSHQKANVKRSMYEFGFLASVVGLLALLQPDDDDEQSKLMSLLLVQTDRLKSELLVYFPLVGWINEGKKLMRSPIASYRHLESSIKLLSYGLAYPFLSEDSLTYQGGMYRGENKMGVWVNQMIPLRNQILKWQYLEKQSSYYKLYSLGIL